MPDEQSSKHRAIIARASEPLEPQGGLVALLGSLAPRNAIRKRSAEIQRESGAGRLLLEVDRTLWRRPSNFGFVPKACDWLDVPKGCFSVNGSDEMMTPPGATRHQQSCILTLHGAGDRVSLTPNPLVDRVYPCFGAPTKSGRRGAHGNRGT